MLDPGKNKHIKAERGPKTVVPMSLGRFPEISLLVIFDLF